MDMQPSIQPPVTSSKKPWIIGGIIVIAIAAFLILRSNSPTPQGIVAGDQNSIVVGDQDPDAVAVLLDQVSLIKPGFVVIQENRNNQPGAVLSVSTLFQPGFYQNKTVIMSIKPGARYFATLYGDDGNGKFDIQNDAVLTDPAGTVVRVQFGTKKSSTPGDIKG